MELSRQEYPSLLAYLQPSQATTVLNERIRAINKLNTDIADWLLERRRLEETYIIGLRKLLRRTQPDNSSLGIFQQPWQSILSATESLAQSHEALAREIEVDVERPLREYATKHGDMKSMSTIQNDLAGLAKELDSAQKKADKLKGKGSRSSTKAAAAISAAADINQQWQSRAPYVFEQLQAIDEHRLNHLRDLLTQYETHEVDQIERNRTTAESCLNALLNIQTADEIKTFAAKVSGGRSAEPRRSIPQSSASTAAPASPPLPPPPRIQDDRASQRSGRSNHGRAPPPAPEPRHTPLGGLKRLGTVMGRRKSIVQVPSTPPERKYHSPFSSFRRTDSSRSFQQVENQSHPGNGLAPVTSREEDPSWRPGSSAQDVPRNTSISDSQLRPKTPNGASAPEPSTASNSLASPIEPEKNVVEQQQTDSEGYSVRPDTIDEISRVQQEAAASEDLGLNLTIRDQPIKEDEGEANQALNEVANTLRLQAQQSGISRGVGTLRGRRDVRNTIFIPNPPAPAEDAPSGLTPIPSPLPSSTPAPATTSAPTSPPRTKKSSGMHDDVLSDNTSVHSSQTLHSLSGPISHPELSEPGLNASMVETVNAWFTEGSVTRAFVVGEMALAYNPTTAKASSNEELIRLDNFQVLEKVAANPAFITDAAHAATSIKGKEKATGDDDRKGEYVISLPHISKPIPTVAFKYQVHLDPSDLIAYCPVIFNPTWKIEEFQASVIIGYTLNPKFISSAFSPESPPTSIVLNNLVLTVHLDLSPQEDEATKQTREVARATGAVMYPNTGATFRRKISGVTWKIPEQEVVVGQDGRFLARFSTSASWPRRGKVEAKFELRNADSGAKLGISAYIPIAEDSQEQKQKQSDPFADADATAAVDPKSPTRTWKEVSTQRKLAAGRYIAS
ncbi:hypothetical protein AJ80_08121 [Polytolypa hystricis UAMH7299]|uniref:FCH domain-containing protein n=1 Tax=Polytolypa hystricis (strain UAMH7299) TaxID=1447883 RepID=A0A2B7X4X8_POLH7|nr:hypothetical protein AJ80_08121 [Polytolypa hystricis UAMH7299]